MRPPGHVGLAVACLLKRSVCVAQLSLPLELPEASPARPALRRVPARRTEEPLPSPPVDGATPPPQLDLFASAQRHYTRAEACLAALDLDGCRAGLAAHREACPDGRDPQPLAEAADWLDRRIPVQEDDPDSYGRRCLALCRLLRESGALPPLLVALSGLRGACAAAVARRALAWAREAGLAAETVLEDRLPWAVLNLVAGDLAGAQRGLLRFLNGLNGAPAGSGAWLALAEACEGAGNDQEAAGALREGYGLDPDGTSWGPAGRRADSLRAEYRGDFLFDGAWWLVGAYLEERLPRYVLSDAARVAERHRQFIALCQGAAPSPVRFFAGLFLSEQSALLPHAELVAVRRTLRELHPEAYRVHMERLEELGPPAAPPGVAGLAG